MIFTIALSLSSCGLFTKDKPVNPAKSEIWSVQGQLETVPTDGDFLPVQSKDVPTTQNPASIP